MSLLDKIKIIVVRVMLEFRTVCIHILEKILFKQFNNPKKILIHRIGTFGDSIVALPAVASIRTAFPNAQIDFLTTHATAINLSSIIEDGFFEKTYLINKKNRKTELKKLQNCNYDLFIDIPQKYGLYKSMRNIFFARFYLGIESAFGWDNGFTKLFAKEQMLYMPPKREVDRFLDTLQANGIRVAEKYPLKLRSNSELVDFVLEYPREKNIAFCIGTNVQANEWPIENWIKLAIELVAQGYEIILIGGEQEKEKAARLKVISTNIHDFCGKLSIAQSGLLLQNCFFGICHDTGAMHLAYAVGTRVVALFSTRQFYTKWTPPKDLGIVLSTNQKCSGCFKSKCRDNICMKDISSEEVLLEIQH